MKRLTALLLLALIAAAPEASAPKPAAVEDGIEVFFSPDGGCTAAIVHELNRAATSFDVAAYSFTSAPIAEAVKKAHERGVKVSVVLDVSQETSRYSSATYLFNAGVPVFIHDKSGQQHNKFIVLDGSTLITGSFNFSKQAEEQNTENLLVIRGKKTLVDAYLTTFKKLLDDSHPYKRE